MAKRLKDMGDWKLVSQEPTEMVSGPATPTRRTRRGMSEQPEGAVELIRESDGTVLKKGDCVLISGEPKRVAVDGDSYHAVIIEISSSINTYVQMRVLPLVKPGDDASLENLGEVEKKKEGADGDRLEEEGAKDEKNDSFPDEEIETDKKSALKKEDEEKVDIASSKETDGFREKKGEDGEKVKDDSNSSGLVEQNSLTEKKAAPLGAENSELNAVDSKNGGHSETDREQAIENVPQTPQKQEVNNGNDNGNVNGNDTSNETDDLMEIPEENSGFLSNELLLTSEQNDVLLRDIIDKVQVLSAAQFAQVEMDASLETSVFMCRRATDRHIEKFSTSFDYCAWHALLMRSSPDAVQFLAEKTSIIVSPKKKQRPVKSISERFKPSGSPSKRKFTVVSDSGDSSASEGDEDDESSTDSDSSEDSRPKTKRGTPAKKRGRKKKDDSAPTTPSKRHAVAKQVASVLSPHNRGFKVKSGSILSRLPSLSRQVSESRPDIGAHRASEAFRELREKLHTSTRVSSLPCREDQLGDIFTALETAVVNKKGTCIYLSGQPGVGKTATVREAIELLRASVQQGYMDDFDYFELNCLSLLAPNAAYEKLYEHVSGIKVTPSNARLLLQEFFARDTFDAERRPLIVLVDELDQLVTKSQEVIYNFFNWPTFEHSQLVVLAVANTMDLPERALSNKVASRLGLNRYAFRGYTEQELGIIIAHRLTLLSSQNRRTVEISEDAMRFASKKVSIVSGDARRALTICRRAVEIAEEDFLASTNTDSVPEKQQSYSVRISHIASAISETVNSPVMQVLHNLSFASKAVLATVILRIRRSGTGEVPLGDVMDEMRNSLALLSTKGSTQVLRNLAKDADYVSLLYGDGHAGNSTGVRLHHVTSIIHDLVEQGILNQQNVRSDRHRLVSLKISESEITPVISRDLDIAAMM